MLFIMVEHSIKIHKQFSTQKNYNHEYMNRRCIYSD